MLDFNALAGDFGSSSKLWADGDFDYNTTVNLLDLKCHRHQLRQGCWWDVLGAGGRGGRNTLGYALLDRPGQQSHTGRQQRQRKLYASQRSVWID